MVMTEVKKTTRTMTVTAMIKTMAVTQVIAVAMIDGDIALTISVSEASQPTQASSFCMGRNHSSRVVIVFMGESSWVDSNKLNTSPKSLKYRFKQDCNKKTLSK